MPLKYKKLIVLFSLCIMLIGLGMFSLVSPSLFSSSSDRFSSQTIGSATFGAIEVVDGMTADEIQEELEELMERYFTAKQQVDLNVISDCVSNIAHVDEKKLLAEAEYVESYQNIQCLVMDGAVEGSYRVYVRYDVKIMDIDTLMPSLNALYVTRTDDDAFEIYLGTFEKGEQEYLEKLDNSKRVRQLVRSVQDDLRAVISRDDEVREFYEMLEQGSSAS